ncbi:hypothetical protein Tco_0885408 [Tanacetum coccineum]
MAFGGIHMTWDHLEKKRTRLRLYTKSLEEICIQTVETALRFLAMPSGFASDGVRTLVMASECSRPKETLKDSASQDKEDYSTCARINTVSITLSKFTQPKRTYNKDLECEIVMVKMPKSMAWLDDKPIGDLDTMEDKAKNPSPQSTPQVLPSFEVYTSPVTHPEDVEKTIGIPMEVIFDKKKLGRS